MLIWTFQISMALLNFSSAMFISCYFASKEYAWQIQSIIKYAIPIDNYKTVCFRSVPQPHKGNSLMGFERYNIGKSTDELIARWNTDNPTDQVVFSES